MNKGDHVRITATKPDGAPHPHAGKTGVITDLWLIVPRVTVQLDRGQVQGGTFAVVSPECLEPIP